MQKEEVGVKAGAEWKGRVEPVWGRGHPSQIETYPGRLHNDGGASYPSEGKCRGKINGLNKAGEGESSICGWEGCRWKCLRREKLWQSCDPERRAEGRMAAGEVKDDALFWKGVQEMLQDMKEFFFFPFRKEPSRLALTWPRLHVSMGWWGCDVAVR